VIQQPLHMPLTSRQRHCGHAVVNRTHQQQ
jgi:hypothetical protein